MSGATPAPGPVVELFHDMICPWCHIAAYRVRRATDIVAERTGVRLHVRPRAYELNPQMPSGGMRRRDYRTAKFGSWERSRRLDADTVAAAARDGDAVTFDYDTITRTPNSRAAHRLIAVAEQTEQRGMAVAEQVLTAYFRDGRDIGDVAVLTAIAEQCQLGINGVQVQRRLADPAPDAMVTVDEDLAERLGIRSVPALNVGGALLTGAVEVAVLVEALTPLAGGLR